LYGLMMERPLLIADILSYAAEVHAATEVISETVEGGRHRTTYGGLAQRIAQLAHALDDLGVRPGDRVATLAWNGYRHFELYYAVSCLGAVCHTINPRLFADQIVFIVQHAEDKLLFADLTFLPLIEKLRDRLPIDLKIIAMTDRDHMPEVTTLPDLACYEDLIAGKPITYAWPSFDERTACGLCYTSGTTGDPKGALYSHRSTVLHAFSYLLAKPEAFSHGVRILPVVPLFHVNAWGFSYTAALAGSALVFPGSKLDGISLFDLMDEERVTLSAGVPTVWQGLLTEMTKRGRKPVALEHVLIGGSTPAGKMIDAFERDFGITVTHGWGMTEMSPLGTCSKLSVEHDRLSDADRRLLKQKQGRRIFGVDLKIVDDEGRRLPHDGRAVGHLAVRGNNVVSGYYRNEAASCEAIDAEGWLKTGDISSIDPSGFMTVVDRSKDLIKSGGDWISSIELESVAAGCPGIATCAVIGVSHPKWGERPLLVVVKQARGELEKADILSYVSERVAKWQVPDDVVFVPALPMTATGKIAKKDLREQCRDYYLRENETIRVSSGAASEATGVTDAQGARAMGRV
jgi:3-(methylthio)propionyl---CoA ligase